MPEFPAHSEAVHRGSEHDVDQDHVESGRRRCDDGLRPSRDAVDAYPILLEATTNFPGQDEIVLHNQNTHVRKVPRETAPPGAARLFYNLHMRANRGDLTAAATIRETAMRLFAQRGAAAVTVREIAAEAGVSPSLVIHHYGSKDGLREAVDNRAIALVDALVTELTAASGGGPSASLAAALSNELERDPLLPAYLRRLLIDGGKPAETLFRTLFEAVLSGFATLEAAGLVRPSSDPEVRTAFLLVNDLAVVLLRDPVHDVLGVDPLARSGMERWTAQVLDVYSRGVLTIGEVSSSETEARGAV